MKKSIIFALWLVTLTYSNCDDGPVYEKEVEIAAEGRTVHLTGRLSGIDRWTDGYSVVLAGFEEGNNYAVISKPLPTSNADGEEAELILTGIKENVSTVELCVINRLRERMVTFQERRTAEAPETIEMNVGNVDVGMYSAIQRRIFNTTCVHCHGGTTQAAAGLMLTERASYQALVGQPSNKEEGWLRVTPGDAEGSLLHRLLRTDLSKTWRYDHSKEVLAVDWLELMDQWMNHGALE